MRRDIYVSFDVEADGPIPGDYSMSSIGGVVVDRAGMFDRTFYRELKPISEKFDPEAAAVSGLDRRKLIAEGADPADAMRDLAAWADSLKDDKDVRAVFVSDNAGFDWGFANWYLHHFAGRNPFGFSCMSLTSLFKGFARDVRASFKHLRKTKHSHNALDDARGNAEAIHAIIGQGLVVPGWNA